MKPRLIITLALAVSILFQFVATELIVHSPDSIAGTYTAFPIIYRNNFHNLTIDGQIVFRNATDVIDKIVLVPWFRGTYLSQIRTEQNRGAKAVIINVQQGIYPGQANYVMDSADVADVTLSAWQISLDDWNKIASALATLQNTTLNATLNPIGVNPWKAWNDTFMIFFQVFITLFSLANIGFAIYRLTRHVKETGCRRKLPQICLSLLIAGNTLRVVHIAIDPVVSRAVFPIVMQQLVLSLSHPFSLSVTILITFYWHDVMHGMSLNVNQMLGKFKIPFIIIIVILYGFEIGFGITRALTVLTGVFITTMITVNSSIYSAVCLAFAIFFFVTAGKLSKVLKGKGRKDSKRGRTLGTITTHILVVGGCLVSHVIIFVILANTAVSYKPNAYGTVWFCSYLILCVQDLFQILVLVPKATKKTSSKSSNKISTTTERL